MNITIKIEAEGIEKAITLLANRIGSMTMGTAAQPESPVAEEKSAKKRKSVTAVGTAEAPASSTTTACASPAEAASPQREYTLEDVRARLGELSSDGKKEEIKSLFAKFGVAKLTELQPEKFGELLAAAEAL